MDHLPTLSIKENKYISQISQSSFDEWKPWFKAISYTEVAYKQVEWRNAAYLSELLSGKTNLNVRFFKEILKGDWILIGIKLDQEVVADSFGF
jgi:hypothetical protein